MALLTEDLDMKRILSLIFATTLIFAAGCSEDKTPSGPNSMGSVDASVYVAIGNSVTAGYQNGALYEGAQKYSFPNLLAERLGTNFVQPLVMEPGTGQRISIVSMNPVTLATAPSSLVPLVNASHPEPFNNLGIPGAVLADATDETDFAQNSASRGNPFFLQVLRDQQQFGKSIIKQALGRTPQPTLITFWMGNNDVLGFATSGGISPAAPVPANAFDLYITSALTALRQGAPQATILVANIPDVGSLPFFTTVGPALNSALKTIIPQRPDSMKLWYQVRLLPNPDSTNFMRPKNVLVTLPGMAYAPYLGLPTGKYYRDLAARRQEPIANVIPAGVDTTYPFALHPKNPWPDALTLDLTEQTLAENAIQSYNSSVESAINRLNNKPGQPNLGLVDMNALFAGIHRNGYVIAGETFTTQFISGGLFSLDGIHPSSKGQAVIANEFIRAMNRTYSGTNLALIDVSKIPGIPVPAGKAAGSKRLEWRADPWVFDSILQIFRP